MVHRQLLSVSETRSLSHNELLETKPDVVDQTLLRGLWGGGRYVVNLKSQLPIARGNSLNLRTGFFSQSNHAVQVRSPDFGNVVRPFCPRRGKAIRFAE